MGANETEDLEALFERVAAESAAAPAPAAAPAAMPAAAPEAPAAEPLSPTDVFQRVGALTRSLHDALRELGYDKSIGQAVEALPDARSRLNYIADLTGKAAEKVLGAVERGKAQQQALREDAGRLAADWDRLHAGALSVEQFQALAGATREFLRAVPARSGEADRELTEIMMAQDFHDLTGQVVQKIGQLSQRLEEQLVKLLLETTPPERRAQACEAGMNGPVIDAAGRDDVVTSQAQVDDLLESLGF